MMLEQHLLSAMISAESRQQYFIACAYGTTYAKFLDAEEIPSKPIEANSVVITQDRWQRHYFKLLDCIVIRMKDNLAEVRAKYGRLNESPRVIKRKVAG